MAFKVVTLDWLPCARISIMARSKQLHTEAEDTYAVPTCHPIHINNTHGPTATDALTEEPMN